MGSIHGSEMGAPGRAASSSALCGSIPGARMGASCSAVTAPPLARITAAAAIEVRLSRSAFGSPSPKSSEKHDWRKPFSCGALPLR